MTKQEKQKLNEKLEKWRGFEFNNNWSATSPYKAPDGNILQEWTPFTDSLDVCFKWLVPKLKRWDAGNCEDKSIYFTCAMQDTIFPSAASAESLPLALCLAIEKLIDAEKLKGGRE